MATAMAEETPPYSFVAKNGQVAWDAVMGFDLAPFLSGQNVAPNALGALDEAHVLAAHFRVDDPGKATADDAVAADGVRLRAEPQHRISSRGP